MLYTGSLKDAPSSFQGTPSELASQLLFSKPTSRYQKERAQQLRALVLGEALGSSPRTYTAAHTYLSITPVLGDLMPFSDLHRHQEHVGCTYVPAGKTS